MCSCHDTLPSSTLQNQGIFSSFIIYVILVLSAFFFFSSRLTRALERRRHFLSCRLSNYGLFQSHLPLLTLAILEDFYLGGFFGMIHLLFPS